MYMLLVKLFLMNLLVVTLPVMNFLVDVMESLKGKKCSQVLLLSYIIASPKLDAVFCGLCSLVPFGEIFEKDCKMQTSLRVIHRNRHVV